MSELSKLDRQNIWHPFTPLVDAPEQILISSAEGIYLHTADGRKIIDAVSSWWVNIHGHSNASIAQAIATQAATLEHVIFAGFTHEPAIRLSSNLLSILPKNQKKIFFSDNGSTAVEVALKMAMQYWFNTGKPRRKLIALDGAYHGDTFGAMSVGERGLFTNPFSPYLFDVTFIAFPDGENEERVLETFKNQIDENTAAFIFEPLVQGAGGMRMYSHQVLDRMIAYAQAHEVICIADEVFTGFGRTGKFFASDYLTHQPDIMAVSKGITGGALPLGVTSCSEKILEGFRTSDFSKTFFHGHSYTANPITCAAANASFDLLTKEDCVKRISAITQHHHEFVASLRGHSKIREARCLGTILAVELKNEEPTTYSNPIRKKIYSYFLDRNILLRPLGNIIYVLPPYVITDVELKHIYNEIKIFVGSL